MTSPGQASFWCLVTIQAVLCLMNLQVTKTALDNSLLSQTRCKRSGILPLLLSLQFSSLLPLGSLLLPLLTLLLPLPTLLLALLFPLSLACPSPFLPFLLVPTGQLAPLLVPLFPVFCKLLLCKQAVGLNSCTRVRVKYLARAPTEQHSVVGATASQTDFSLPLTVVWIAL